jgi:hypothetical protein
MTKVSVEKARRSAPATSITAPSWSWPSASAPKAGRKTCSVSIRLSFPPPPWAMTTVG